MSTKSLVPFSPVPTHVVPILFKGHRIADSGPVPWGDLAYDACPMRVLWEDNYRLACLELIWHNEEKALVHAHLGNDLEEAYMSRKFAELNAEKAQVPA